MRCTTVLLGVCLLLAVLPAGAQAGDPLWTRSVSSEIAGLSLTPDGSYVLASGERLCLFAGNGTPLWQEWTADAAACSADGNRIVVGHGPSLILVDRDGARVWRQNLPSACATLGISADGKRITVADRFGRVYFYDADGTLRATADTSKPSDGIASEIRAVDLSGKGEYVGVASTSGLFYYSGTGKKVWAHEGLLESSTAVAVSGTGNEVAAGSDASVRFLNHAGKVLWTYRCPRPVTALAISEDGSRVAFGMQDNTLTCLDREGEVVWTFAAGGWIRDVALSKDGSRVLAGSIDRQAYLFDGAGRLLETYALGGWVNHVALTTDGTAGVAASLHEVIGISTTAAAPPVVTPSATITTSATTATPSPATPSATTATPTTTPENATAPPPVEEGGGLPLLLLGLLACGAVAGGGYLYWQRRWSAPVAAEETLAVEEETTTAAEETLAIEEEVPAAPAQAPSGPWCLSLDEGRTREAARLLSREMTALIRSRTGSHVVTVADALAACPGEREGLQRFFADADRLAYGHDDPAREDIEALEAAYLRLAGEIG